MVGIAGFVEAAVYGALALGLVIPALYSLTRWGSEAAVPLSWIGSALILGASIALLTAASRGPVYFYDGLVVYDSLNAFILLFASLAALLALWATGEDAVAWPTHPSYYGLIPITLFGMFFLAGANDALVFIASWLLVSVASYVIVATPGDAESRAAAAKYILMGALATLFAAAWLGLHAGLVGLSSFNPLMLYGYSVTPLSLLAIALLLAAVGFKLGVFPFHWWLPSVYGKADGRGVSFVAAAVKLAFIAFVVRLLWTTTGWSPLLAPKVALFLAGLAVLTMTYGNIAALTTRDLQRILAYSSIAHIGYILAGMAALVYLAPINREAAALAAAAIAVHAAAYALAKSSLFPFSSLAGRDLSALRGLYASEPLTAVTSSTLLLSLLGMPPLLGFWGKLFLILAAAKYSIPLVVAIAVNTGISAAYYVVAVREILSGKGAAKVELPANAKTALLASTLLTIVFGLLALYLIPLAAP